MNRRVTNPGPGRRATRGFSLLEVLAVVVILAIVAALAIPRFGGSSREAKITSCRALQGHLNIQSQLWFRNKGTWPAADLSDLMADQYYFPEGPVACPVDGSPYQFDPATRRVTPHEH